jgi:hypothetical protein
VEIRMEEQKASGKTCPTSNDNYLGRPGEPGPAIVSRSPSAAEKVVEAAFQRALARAGRAMNPK